MTEARGTWADAARMLDVPVDGTGTRRLASRVIEAIKALQDSDRENLAALAKALKADTNSTSKITWDRMITLVGVMAREMHTFRQHEQDLDEAHRITQQTCLDLHEALRRVGTSLGLPGGSFSPSMVLERARRIADERYELLKDKDSHTCGSEHAPPTLTAIIELHEDNYRRIGEALGIEEEQPTVHDILMASTQLEAMAKDFRKSDEARIALVKRVQELEAELAAVHDDQEAAERAEHDWAPSALPHGVEFRAVEDLARALKVRQIVINLDAVEHGAEPAQVFDDKAQANRRNILAEYDVLTLALAYKWGDEKKEKFIRDITDGTLLAKLEHKYNKRMGIED